MSSFVLASAKLFAMEEAMLHFSRSASIIGAPLIVAALLSCVTPAGAKITANGTSLNKIAANGTSLNKISTNGTSLNKISANGMTMQALSATAVAQNEIPASARITTGSALTDLNGVAVEAVIIPETAIR
jgi:hypothetical protein